MAPPRGSKVAAAALAICVSAVAAERVKLPLPSFLEKGALDRMPDRALRIRDGDVYFTSDGPPVKRTRDSTDLAPVIPLEMAVIEAGARPRVLLVNDTVRVAVYIDPATLAEVALPGAVIVGAPSAGTVGPKAPGVRLAPGARLLRDGQPEAGFAHVTFDDASWRSQGYIEIAKLGHVFRPGPLPPDAFQPDAVLRGVPSLLDAPRGKTLATPHPSTYPVERLGPPRDGFVLVRARSEHIEVVGWAKADEVLPRPGVKPPREPPQEDVLSAHGTLSARQVAAGTPLFDGPSGHIVGVTLSELGVSIDEERPDGWWRCDFNTSVGDLPLWLAP